MAKAMHKVMIAVVLAAASGATGEIIKSDGSDLGITIMGAIVQKNSEDNVALIKEQAGTVKAVKKDHIVLDKFKVIAVHPDFIELVGKDAKRYQVYKDKFAELAATKKVDAPTASVGSELYKEDGFERSKGKVNMTAMYRDKLIKEDLARVLMQATAEPHMENGAIIGFKMSQIDEGSIYAKAGLVDGDVITGINGQELSSISGAITLLRSLKGTDHIDVEIRRGGQSQKIQVDVN